MKIQNNNVPQYLEAKQQTKPQPTEAKAQSKPQKIQQERDPKILQAAKMYEQVFLNEMVKSMRNSVQKSDLVQENMAEKIFTDQLYDNYVEQWSDSGGVGLADIVYDQLIEKFGRMPTKPKMPMKPNGNLRPSPKTEGGEMQKINSQPQSLLYKIKKQEGHNEVVAPWPGKITGSTKLNDTTNALFLQHDNGLKSTLVFDGVLNTSILSGVSDSTSAGSENKIVSENSKLGTISLNSPNLLWKIEKV